MKLPAILLATFILSHPTLSFAGISLASISERIAQDEGYRLFTFKSKNAQPYQLVVRFNRSESLQNILNIPEIKECIIAVKLTKNSTIKMISAYFDRGSTSETFPADHFPTFSNSFSKSTVQIDDPFFGLSSATDDLELILRPRKAQQDAAANP